MTDLKRGDSWISVKDRLPEDNGRYLVFYNDTDSAYVCRFYNGVINQFDVDHSKVTHWMPLPKPPEKD